MLLRHIRYFLAVANSGNFTRAAEAVHVSQPALSQQIRQLEDSLGVQLFDRTGRTIRLTDAGEAYRQYAQRALQDLDAGKRALHDVRDLSRGTLRLAMTPTFTPYLVGSLVEIFRQRYPALALCLTELPQEKMERLILDDEIDLGIAFSPLHADELEATPVFEEDLSLVVSASHPYATGSTSLVPAALAAEPFALLTSAFATRKYVTEYLTGHGVTPHVAMEVNSVGAVIEAVRCGKLVTILPAAIARRLRGLRAIPLVPAPPRRTVFFLQRQNSYRSAASQAFVAFAAEAYHSDATELP
ncbi:transcriptional regulator CynR [Cupriavidus sp. 2KB_3]|uniref:transcriptional regulator CynR n=1 Tax=Cupriavidus sp. 2KB_3 TaxID=3232980 RepID=UPI003F937F9B